MDGMLSQDEINALLNGMNDDDNNNSNDNADMTTQDDGSSSSRLRAKKPSFR